MPWIESHTHLIRHHKTLRMALRLEVKPVVVMGYLHNFWHNVLELREDGDITAWTPKEVAYYSGYEGDSEKFYEALKDGWIDNKNGRILVHDWINYAGRYLQARYRSANPERLEAIRNKYSQTAQSANQPNQPNQPNHNTMSSKHDLSAPILYLNEKAGRSFSPKSKTNIQLVRARYAEGRTLADFKVVIDKKVYQWSKDEKMMIYLRPETLFRASHFESYLNEPLKKEKNAHIPESIRKYIKEE